MKQTRLLKLFNKLKGRWFSSRINVQQLVNYSIEGNVEMVKLTNGYDNSFLTEQEFVVLEEVKFGKQVVTYLDKQKG